MKKENKASFKVDLTLVKKLLNELETTLNAANAISEVQGDMHQYITEMSKAQGLSAGVMKEASLLTLDINHITTTMSTPMSGLPADEGLDALTKLFDALPGKGKSKN